MGKEKSSGNCLCLVQFSLIRNVFGVKKEGLWRQAFVHAVHERIECFIAAV
jgi:hypothetical protein